MRKLTLFLAAVSLVLFAEKARCHELTFSIDPNARNSLRYSDLRVEESDPLTIRTGRFLSVDAVPGVATKPQTWNRYVYAFNNPFQFVDQTGLWPTDTHNRILKEAFPRLSPVHLKTLMDASAYVDRASNQSLGNSYQHGMRAPYQSVAMARTLAAAYYTDQIAAAQAALASGDVNGAYFAVGQAMHMVSDMTSPVHRGFQMWIPMPQQMMIHAILESRAPTGNEMKMAVAVLRAAFAQVFGVEMAEQVSQSPRSQNSVGPRGPAGAAPTTTDGGTVMICVDGICR